MLRERGHDPQAVAHFVNRFADDVGLLPDHMFTRMLQHALPTPARLSELAGELFRAMASGGRVGFETVDWFNGSLFNDDTTLPLEKTDIETVVAASEAARDGLPPATRRQPHRDGVDTDRPEPREMMKSNNSKSTQATTAAIGVLAVLAVAVATPAPAQGQDATWNGLVVAPEARCSPYDSGDYQYSQSVEDRIIRSLGGVYGPYTGRWFGSKRETDIEHIVARSEAHDSGLCRTDQRTRRRFSEDLRNLTLAAPSVNRNQKRDHDAAGWLPPMNRCWFAARVIDVKRAYGLTVDRRERDALARALSGCEDTDIDMTPRGTVAAASPPASRGTAGASGGTDALALYDDNGNGRITCAEARRHGIAPVPRTHPAYQYMRDGDNDGVVCE